MAEFKMNYKFSDILSISPSLNDQQMISNSLQERINVLQACLNEISSKIEKFKKSTQVENWEESCSKLKTTLESKLNFHMDLLKVNLFTYKNEIIRERLTKFKYKPIFKDLSDPLEFFSQKFLIKVDKTSEDFEGDLKVKHLLREKYGFEVEGHCSEITSLDISNDQSLIITGSMDSTVKLWNYENFQLIRTFFRHKNKIVKVFFKNLTFSIVSASYDGRIIILNQTGELEDKIKTGSPIISIDFSQNEKFIAYAIIEDKLKILNIENRENEYTIITETSRIIQMKLSFNAKSLICGYFNYTFIIFDVEGQTSSIKINDFVFICTCISFSNDEKFFISGSSVGQVNVFSTETKEIIKLYRSFDSITSVDMSFNNYYVIAAGSNFICIWNLVKKSLVRLISMELSTITQVKFSKNALEVIAGGSNSFLYKFFSHDKNNFIKSEIHDKNVIAYKILNNKDLAITATKDQDVRIWDLKKKKLFKKINIVENICKSISISRSEKYLIIISKRMIQTCLIR